jgi:tetratricopeptide (TPR) repeat protein
MKHLVLIFIMNLFAFEAISQTTSQNKTVTGKINLFNQRSATYDNNISIYPDDATVVHPNPGGFFTFNCTTKIAGEKFSIVVDKKNDKSIWVVLETDKLTQRVPNKSSDLIDEIRLCREEDYKAAIKTLPYYQDLQKIAQQEFEAEKSKLEKKIERADNNASELKIELDNLKAKYELTKKNNEEVSITFSKTSSSDINLEKKVAEEFEKYKNLDSSLKVLDDKIINKIYQTVKQNGNKLELTQANTNYITKAHLYISKSDFTAAEKYFLIAYNNDNNNLQLLTEIGNFYVLQNQAEKALIVYNKALSTCTSDNERAFIQYVLSILYFSTLQNDRSIELLDKSIESYSKLAQIDEERNLPFIGVSLVFKKALYPSGNSKANTPAERNPTEIFKKLVEKDTSRYLSYLALCQIQDGLLQIQLQNNESTPQYPTVINSLNGMPNKSSESFHFLQIYASVLNCLELAKAGNNPDCRNQIDSILYSLTEINFPTDYSTNLNSIIPNMDYIESMESKLADPINFIPMYSSLLQTSASIYSQLHTFSSKDKVIAAYEKFERELRKAFLLNPERYRSLLTMNLGNLGVFYASNKDFKKAFVLSEESIQLSNALIAKNDNDANNYLKAIELMNLSSVCFYNLVYAENNKEIKKKGKKNIKESIAILKRLNRKNKVSTSVFKINLDTARKIKKQYHQVRLARMVYN